MRQQDLRCPGCNAICICNVPEDWHGTLPILLFFCGECSHLWAMSENGLQAGCHLPVLQVPDAPTIHEESGTAHWEPAKKEVKNATD